MIINKKASTAENSYVFEIMGDEYVVKGSEQPYMEEIIHHLESVVDSVMSSHNKLNKCQVAVLAALKIADELYKLRQEYQYRQTDKSKVESQKSKVEK